MIYIDEIIKEKGITKTDLAKRMGLSRESLYRIISGNPTLENIQKLAGAMGVSVSELFEQPSNTINCPKCGTKLTLQEK